MAGTRVLSTLKFGFAIEFSMQHKLMFLILFALRAITLGLVRILFAHGALHL